jgi:hypothetical protein
VKEVVLQRIQLNIYGVSVLVESDMLDLLKMIKLDFWSFMQESASSVTGPYDLTVKISKDSLISIPPNLQTVMQTQTSLSFDQGDFRYCDYYGEALSRIHFVKNEVLITGQSVERLHEVAYLVILSRVGKILDLNGMHKLHAFAILFKESIAFVCMMPTKGGKSTLLSELLKDPRVKMLSDDIPLIDSMGRLHPFPIKIGFNQVPQDLEVESPEENIYTMERQSHGLKYLVSTKGLGKKVVSEGRFSRIILAEGFRFSSKDFRIERSSWLQTFKGLLKHGVVGVGSPIVIEYFWQSGMRDFFIKTKIFFLRLMAFINLCTRAKKIRLFCGSQPKVIALGILEYLEKESNN